MAVVSEEGEVLLELQVETSPKELRRVVSGVGGPKRVVMEEGPMSAMVADALRDVADKVISCDPTKNALISKAEDSNDERDARRLAMLARTNSIHEVYIPPEPYRTLRSLMHYDYTLATAVVRAKNGLKALCRRNGVSCSGKSVYTPDGRVEAARKMPNPTLRWQFESLWRRMNQVRRERLRANAIIRKHARKVPALSRLRTIPGVAWRTGPIIAAYVVDPGRFKSRSAVASYAGLGIASDWSNWKMTKRARASKRGNREFKRALFIAARCALIGENALSRRYDARIASGWEDRKAIRDVARTILRIACSIWEKGKYDDAKVSVPEPTRRDR